MSHVLHYTCQCSINFDLYCQCSVSFIPREASWSGFFARLIKGRHESELMLIIIGPWHYVYAHSPALLRIFPRAIVTYITSSMAAKLVSSPTPARPVPTSSPCGLAYDYPMCSGLFGGHCLGWYPPVSPATVKLSGSALTDLTTHSGPPPCLAPSRPTVKRACWVYTQSVAKAG